MKKYIKPNMKVVEIENEVILAGSGEDTFYNTTTTGSQLGKKHTDDWDEEDF